jgi:hypothetical protein
MNAVMYRFVHSLPADILRWFLLSTGVRWFAGGLALAWFMVGEKVLALYAFVGGVIFTVASFVYFYRYAKREGLLEALL